MSSRRRSCRARRRRGRAANSCRRVARAEVTSPPRSSSRSDRWPHASSSARERATSHRLTALLLGPREAIGTGFGDRAYVRIATPTTMAPPPTPRVDPRGQTPRASAAAPRRCRPGAAEAVAPRPGGADEGAVDLYGNPSRDDLASHTAVMFSNLAGIADVRTSDRISCQWSVARMSSAARTGDFDQCGDCPIVGPILVD